MPKTINIKIQNMRNYIFKIISFLAVSLLAGSCLKDDIGEDWTDSLKGKMYAEVWNAGFQALALQPVPDPVVFKFLVNIATDEPPTQAITVSLAVNPDAIAKYNAIKGTDYKLFPYIELIDKTVTIAAGTRNAYAHVRVWNANTLNACDNFMAPITITSATGGVIPADPLNQGSRLMALPISNPFAGSYQVTGTFNHPTAGIRAIDEVKTLSTVNCSTVETSIGDLGGAGLFIKVNTDNSVTITGELSASQPLVMVTGQPNVYDPATKTFTLNYYYVGSGGNRVISEVYVRQ
jgi:hypothetical protein